MQRENQTKFILLELIAVCFCASSGVFVRYSALGPVNTAFYRMLFALPMLYLLARKDLKGLTRREVGQLLLAGVFFAGDIILFNLSVTKTAIANTNLFTNLTIFTVVPVSALIFKERIPKHLFTGAAVTLAGVVLLVLGKAEPSSSGYVGDLLACGASVFYGLYLLVSYRLRERFSGHVITFFCIISCLFVMPLYFVPVEGMQIPHGFAELWPLLGLAVCLQVFGHNLMAYCQGKVSVNLSSIICLTQPAVAALYSLTFFGEKLTWMEIAGICIVVAGVYIVKHQYSDKKAERVK